MFEKFFSFNYWFSLKVTILSPQGEKILIGFVSVLLFLSLIFLLLKKIFLKREVILSRFFKRIFKMFFTLGLLGLFFLFFRYENIYILGARFWFLLIILLGIVWAVILLIYLIKKFPKERKAIRDKELFEKYLPKK